MVFSPFILDLLLVALGRGDSSSETDVCEVINMKDVTSLCPNLPPYPYALRHSTGHVVDSVPIIAGGYPSTILVIYRSYVHKYDIETNSWISLGNMVKPRGQYASVPLNGALWVLGGYTTAGSMEKSTEMIFPNGTIVGGPDLPAPRARHCAVTLKGQEISEAIFHAFNSTKLPMILAPNF